MSLGYPLARCLVENIVVDEGLEGVVVVVTGVPKPLRPVKDGTEINSSKVVSLTAKPKKMPTKNCELSH